MSTQLIVYPQTYDGTYNSTFTASISQFLIDGINFSTINSSPSYDSTSPTATQVITNYPPTTGSNLSCCWRLRITHQQQAVGTGGDTRMAQVCQPYQTRLQII